MPIKHFDRLAAESRGTRIFVTPVELAEDSPTGLTCQHVAEVCAFPRSDYDSNSGHTLYRLLGFEEDALDESSTVIVDMCLETVETTLQANGDKVYEAIVPAGTSLPYTQVVFGNDISDFLEIDEEFILDLDDEAEAFVEHELEPIDFDMRTASFGGFRRPTATRGVSGALRRARSFRRRTGRNIASGGTSKIRMGITNNGPTNVWATISKTLGTGDSSWFLLPPGHTEPWSRHVGRIVKIRTSTDGGRTVDATKTHRVTPNTAGNKFTTVDGSLQ